MAVIERYTIGMWNNGTAIVGQYPNKFAPRDDRNDIAVMSLTQAAEAIKQAARVILLRSGFEPWGEGGWIRDDENGDTCYDTAWALERASLHNVAANYRAITGEP